jgi:peptidoglycan/LPS O-acetylase OafA/YrhL
VFTPEVGGVCAAVIVGALCFRVAIRYGFISELGAHTLMPARADALAAGAWMATALRTGIRLDDIRRHARWLALAALAAVVLIYLRRHSFSEMRFLVQTAGYSCLALGFAGLLALALDSPARPSAFGRTFRLQGLRSLGKYSYAMYCFNPFVLKLLPQLGISVHAFPRAGGSMLPGIVGFGAVYFATTIALALLSWHLYEKHFLRLKDRFSR